VILGRLPHRIGRSPAAAASLMGEGTFAGVLSNAAAKQSRLSKNAFERRFRV
jgi:hypothetical protein